MDAMTRPMRSWFAQLSLFVLLALAGGCSDEETLADVPLPPPVPEKTSSQGPPARIVWTPSAILIARGSQIFRVNPETMVLVESADTGSMMSQPARPKDGGGAQSTSRLMAPPAMVSTSHGLFVLRSGSLLKLDPVSLELRDSLSLLKDKQGASAAAGAEGEPKKKAGGKRGQPPVLVGDDQGLYLFAGSSLRAINPQTLEVVAELKPEVSDVGDSSGAKTKARSQSVALLATSDHVFFLAGSTLMKLSRPGLVMEEELELRTESAESPQGTAAQSGAGEGPDSVASAGARSHRKNVYQKGPTGTLRWIDLETVESDYRAALGGTEGGFQTGQDADLVLSSLGFNRSGGPLLFNHPGGIATDGTALAIADRSNNRVLIWREAPTGNTPPDVVLGQPDFLQNNPGDGLDQMNWPISVEFAGSRLLVADTYNHRVLVWNELPTTHGTPADVVLSGLSTSGRTRSIPGGGSVKVGRFAWPWGLWSDGQRLVLSSTGTREILIWNRFPRTGQEEPDIRIRSRGIGTPRSITSDGKTLMVGDHNASPSGKPGGGKSGIWVWKQFPTSNQAPDFFMESHERSPIWLQGMISDDGSLYLVDRELKRWNEVPTSSSREPDVVFGAMSGHYDGGDGIDMVQVGERMYLLDPNGNKILGFNQLPQRSGAKPDFAVGAAQSNSDTLADHFLQTNPEPATDGRGLFSISSYDKTLYVWKKRPDQSAAAPNHIYHFGEQPQDLAVSGDRLVVAGLMHNLYIWDSLPFSGEGPTRAIHGRLGSVRLQGIQSIAMDERYFYLLDRAGTLSVWEGIPEDGEEPIVQLRAEKGKLASDGETLVLAGKGLWMVSVSALVQGQSLQKVSLSGLRVEDNTAIVAEVGHGSLFVTDRNQNQVWVWSDLQDARRGAAPDAILGAEGPADAGPEIGRDSLFWPNRLAYDGDYLWVGEFKFSGRMLRFSPG